MVLTNQAIASAVRRDKPYKIADGKGLYVFVTSAGAKSIRWKYRFKRKEKCLTLGLHPGLSIEEARRRMDVARNALAFGIDPSDRAATVKALKIPRLDALATIPLPLHKQWVYFAQVATGHIKIGTTTNVAHRLAALQHAHAEPVLMLAIMPGGHAHEALLHQIFDRDRDSGEWFSPSAELMALVDSLSRIPAC